MLWYNNMSQNAIGFAIWNLNMKIKWSAVNKQDFNQSCIKRTKRWWNQYVLKGNMSSVLTSCDMPFLSFVLRDIIFVRQTAGEQAGLNRERRELSLHVSSCYNPYNPEHGFPNMQLNIPAGIWPLRAAGSPLLWYCAQIGRRSVWTARGAWTG